MSRGYIKVYRDIQDHWIWQDPTKLKMWLDIIMMANIKDKRMLQGNELVMISRGTFHTSICHLSERWGCNKRTVMIFLDLLESDNMITQKKTKNGTTIEVLNYKTYQDLSNSKNEDLHTTEHTTDDTTDCTQLKNEKNAKESKETISSVLKAYAPDGDLHEALKSFIEMRTKAKKPLTVRAFKQALDKLNSLSGNDTNSKIAIVDQTLQKGWLTFYELKNNYTSSTTSYVPNKVQQMNKGMYSHDWDYDELEKRQQEHITEKVSRMNQEKEDNGG